MYIGKSGCCPWDEEHTKTFMIAQASSQDNPLRIMLHRTAFQFLQKNLCKDVPEGLATGLTSTICMNTCCFPSRSLSVSRPTNMMGLWPASITVSCLTCAVTSAWGHLGPVHIWVRLSLSTESCWEKCSSLSSTHGMYRSQSSEKSLGAQCTLLGR